MQKRYLIIFSLLVVSVLFIAGCQEAVGRFERPSEISYTYTAGIEHPNLVGRTVLDVKVAVNQIGRCNLLNNKVDVGEIVAIDSKESDNYLVVGCINAVVDSGLLSGINVKPEVRVGQETPEIVRTSQFSRALLFLLDQRLVTPKTVLSSSEVFVVRGSVAYTGF